MPKKVFISHSYKDAEARKRLLALLPKNVEPFVFPPITVPPEQMVSNNLLDAINACNGLIYLQGGASAESFWVALERDFALRQGKPVFAYDPATGILQRDSSAPISPKVYMSYSRQDQESTRRVVAMLHLRFFDVWFDLASMKSGDELAQRIEKEITYRLQDGGYVVALWSAQAKESKWIDEELHYSDQHVRDRILFALLDQTRLPLLGFASTNVVQLYGDAERSFNQRIDDLIVRLYWLIYRNTRQNQLT